MNVSTTRTLGLALLTASALSGCGSSLNATAIDRLESPAAAHAGALAGEDVPLMRETGLSLLEQLKALADW